MAIIEDMDDLEFEEYRQRLFHSNLNFFEKALEKTRDSQKQLQNPIEYTYAQEISENFEQMSRDFATLQTYIRRINFFMSIVPQPERVFELDMKKLRSRDAKYQSQIQAAKRCFDENRRLKMQNFIAKPSGSNNSN